MTAATPLISIVIPAYNSALYIKETIESVLNQTYEDVEIIVVNDGSTDNTLEVLAEFNEQIELYTTENRGVSHARNFGVSKAAGQLLAFVDSDDIWFPNKLTKQIESMGEFKWSHCDSYYFGDNETGEVKRSDLSEMHAGNVFEKLLLENFITTSTVVIDKEAFEESGGFDETIEALEDWKLWLTVAKQHEIAYVAEPSIKYRVYNGSTSRRARKMLPLHIRMVTSFFDALEANSPLLKLKNKVLAHSCTLCSYIAEDSKDYSFSLYCTFKACRFEPLKGKHWKRIISTLLSSIK